MGTEFVLSLIEAKGKLCPLNLKGDTVKSEMCGAVIDKIGKFCTGKLSIEIQQNLSILGFNDCLGSNQ